MFLFFVCVFLVVVFWFLFCFCFLFLFCCPIICADLRGTAPAPLVPASLLPATPRAHSASRPRPQRSTGSDVRSLVGCHPKETLHCCWVTSVLFSSACSDSTYHLLCPLLTTMLAKSRSQTEWASLQRADRSCVPPPILLCGLSDAEGFDQNCPRQGRRREHRDWGHHESVAWRATEAETLFYFIYAVVDENEDDNWWCYESPFRFETTWQGRSPRLLRAAAHAYCHNYHGVNQARELRHLQCWSSH